MVDDKLIHQNNEVFNRTESQVDTRMRDVGVPPEQKRGRPRELNQEREATNQTAYRRYTREERDHGESEELQELTMISLNIRGFNQEEK